MGIKLEVKSWTTCEDVLCITREAVESVFRKIGVEASEADIEGHAKRLAELMGEGRKIYDQYTFTVENLEITIRRAYYEAIDDECFEECHGYVTVEFEVNGNVRGIRQVVEKLLRDIGADKYVKICE
jgi:hypothetical protein